MKRFILPVHVDNMTQDGPLCERNPNIDPELFSKAMAEYIQTSPKKVPSFHLLHPERYYQDTEFRHLVYHWYQLHRYNVNYNYVCIMVKLGRSIDGSDYYKSNGGRYHDESIYWRKVWDRINMADM